MGAVQMHARRWARFGFTAACLGLGGCANYALLQDAATMPKDEAAIGVGAAVTAYDVEVETTVTDVDAAGQPSQESVETRETFVVPSAVVFLRAGITEQLELHGAAWFPFGASIGAKYMVLGDRTGGFVLSPGLDVTVPITGAINGENFLLMDIMVPLHMGYRFGPAFAGYLTPRYVARILSGELVNAGGGTLGVAIGHRMQVLLEGTAIYYPLIDDVALSGAIGLAL